MSQLAQAPGDDKWQKQDLNSSLLIQSFLSRDSFDLHTHTLEIFDDICGHLGVVNIESKSAASGL